MLGRKLYIQGHMRGVDGGLDDQQAGSGELAGRAWKTMERSDHWNLPCDLAGVPKFRKLCRVYQAKHGTIKTREGCV